MKKHTAYAAFWDAADALDSAGLHGKRTQRPPIRRCVACEGPMLRITGDRVACPRCVAQRVSDEPVRYTSPAKLMLTMLKSFRRMSQRRRIQTVQFLRSLVELDEEAAERQR